ncbi:hypothetical protein Hypma_008862 [Hypsizygus marmoreus]|uniref:Uncharacterized protein n=1 Tax=Hypsizygus marmoreus TaxID=39966 RepID=A0A369JPM7_HYPMA|nr:hypothetical protein Hypma_008862 [Hypsizygus marmoreus]
MRHSAIAPLAILSLVMVVLVVFTIAGIILLSKLLHSSHGSEAHDSESVLRTRPTRHRVRHSSLSGWLTASCSSSTEVSILEVSPSHPMIFGSPEAKGEPVQVMVTPPTPAKRERWAACIEVKDQS